MPRFLARVVVPLAFLFVTSPPMAFWIYGQPGAYVFAVSVVVSAFFLVMLLMGLVLCRADNRSYWFSIVLSGVLYGVFTLGLGLVEGRPPQLTSARFFDPTDGDPQRTLDLSFRTNADGWRSDLDYGDIKDLDGNVLFLGDSMVFGIVPEESTIDALFNRAYGESSNLRMLNAGTPASELGDYYRNAKTFTGFKADWVLVGVYIHNDFLTSNERLKRLLKRFAVIRLLVGRVWPRYVAPRVSPPSTYTSTASPDDAVIPEGTVNPHMLKSLPDIDDALYGRIAEAIETDPYYVETLGRIRDLFPDSRYCVVIIPSKYQVSTRYIPYLRPFGYQPATLLNDRPQTILSKQLRDAGICVLNMTSRLREIEQTRQLYYSIDSHMNADANRIIADSIYELIRTMSEESTSSPPA